MWTKQQIWRALMIAAVFTLIILSAVLFYKIGYLVLIAVLPTLALLFLTDRIFAKTLKSSREQAAQAVRHVRELSHYIAEQENTALILQKSEERYRNAFDYAAVGMALAETSGKLLKVNRKLCRMLGYDEAELLAADYKNLLSREDLESLKLDLARLMGGDTSSFEMESRVRHKSGETRWLNWSASFSPEEADQSAHFIFQLQDITDRKRAEERLAHNALYDALTELPNRTLFLDRLQVAFARATRNFNTKFAVLYIDFDRFKFVNDNFGHLVGDQLLVKIARRLTWNLRAGDTIARLGGDEFVMLSEEISDFQEAEQIAERIRAEMAKPFDLNGQDFFATVSIGIAHWTRDYEQSDLMLRDADIALQQAKFAGRDQYKIFKREMHRRALRLLQIENDLRHALERREFFLAYQPIVTLGDQNPSGFEVLLRWQHPVRGLISPLDFISIAEETGLIAPIGEWILREACARFGAWQRANRQAKDLWISVNVSTKQFTHTDLAAVVGKILAETEFDPRHLKLEVTESAMIENIDYAVELMEKLKKLGIELSIDDFGTGYSSLSYLHRLPLDSLKVDRSFVNQMLDSRESQEIIKTIIALAQSLKLQIVAEGIESAAQMTELINLGCEYGQGYYFAKPLGIAQVEKLIEEMAKPSAEGAAAQSEKIKAA